MEDISSLAPFPELLPLGRVQVLCGEPSVTHLASLALSEMGISACRSAEVKLLLDFPQATR